jgi:hypothetical protein
MGRGQEDIERLRGQIEQWRTTRERRCAMPERLWQAAVALAKEKGVYQVSRFLNLNSGNLKKRVKSCGHKRGDAAGENGFGFVELEGIKLEGMKAAQGVTVEVTDEQGAMMKIGFSVSEGFDVIKVVQAFWRRGQ